MATEQEKQQAREQLRQLISERLETVKSVEQSKEAFDNTIEAYWRVCRQMSVQAKIAEINPDLVEREDGTFATKERFLGRTRGQLERKELSRMDDFLRELEESTTDD